MPTDDTRFRIVFLPVPEQKAGKNRIHLDLTTTSIDDQQRNGRAVGRARRPPHRRRSGPGRRSCRARRPRRQRALRHRAGQLASSPTADVSDRSRATVRARSGTSGAKRSDGRWSGIRTKRPRSARRTAPVRSSPGVRRSPRRSAKNRLHLDIAPPADVDQRAEVDRLVCPRGDSNRHRPRRRRLGGHGRSRWQRVLRVEPPLARSATPCVYEAALSSSSMMVACSALASAEPVPPRPVVRPARSHAVDPRSFSR